MKTLITVFASMMIATSFSISAGSQDHAIMDDQNGQKMGVMGDYHARSMIMDQIVEDPEMRQEMMDKMMQSMDVHQMMNNPAMKARMEKHVGMMQAMLVYLHPKLPQDLHRKLPHPESLIMAHI